MRIDELRRRLDDAGTNEACVDAIADFFASYPLAYGHGTDNAGDEAFWLVGAAQGLDLHGGPDPGWARRPDRDALDRIAALAARRVEQRRPLAYLLGEAWFAGMRFEVDERVLVPRSPLAEVIESGFAPWVRIRTGDRLLDIGTGSGCIAIAAVAHRPGIEADATDSSAAALALAARNAALHDVAGRVRFMEADLFPGNGERYRVIISNPPYVAADALVALPPEYAHEPAAGLVGGPTGLEPVRRILAAARAHLAPDGVLIVEVGDAAGDLERAYPHAPFVWLQFERGGSGVFVLTAEDLEGLE